MMCELVRVGSDPKIAYTGKGTAVLNLSLAYDVGFGENKTTQWVKAAVWGKRAEALERRIGKGDALFVELRDVRVETFDGQDGQPRSVLKADVSELKFAGGGSGGSAPVSGSSGSGGTPAPSEATDDFDDDLPF